MNATCQICNKEMNGSGCVGIIKVGKKMFERIKVEECTCHDCGAKVGKLHHWGCDNETCPKCFMQLISCDCNHTIYYEVETHQDPKYVTKYLKTLTDENLLLRYNLPSSSEDWKKIFHKELKSRKIDPKSKFVNPYDKYDTKSLLPVIKKSRDADTRFLIAEVFRGRGLNWEPFANKIVKTENKKPKMDLVK